MEPSFLGIGKSIWDLLNGFANWFAAAGSFAAAFVALRIANRAARPTAQLTVGHRILIEGHGPSDPPEYVVFRIVNTGDRPIRITQIGWCVRWPRRRAAVQFFDTSMSSSLPTDLTHGQEASWFVPLDARAGGWVTHFSSGFLMPRWKLGMWSLRAQAFSSVGFVFEVKPEDGVTSRLRSKCRELALKGQNAS